MLSTRVISQQTLPPLADLDSPMLWHPTERALWVLSSRQEVWQVAPDGTGQQVLDTAALAMPASVTGPYTHQLHFYFDTARQAPVWLCSTYDELVMGVLDGRKFRLVRQQDGIAPASADTFVFDAKRGVLVHFAGTHDTLAVIAAARAARGGVTVRELGADDVWRDVGTPVGDGQDMYSMAGWDERRGLAVLIEDSTGQTRGWDGARWHKLGKYPTDPWRPYHAGQAPGGGLVIVQKQRVHGEEVGVCYELGAKGWVARDAFGLERWGGIARDPDSKRTYLYGPWCGAGTCARTLGTLDASGVALAGQRVPALTAGSVSGPVRFLDTLADDAPAPVLRFTVSARGLADAGTVHVGTAHHSDAAGDFALTSDGELHVGGARTKAPAGWKARLRPSIGSDGKGVLLVTGGEVTRRGRRLSDTWRYDGTWTQLATQGRAPGGLAARVAFDPARQAWLVVGGEKKYRQISDTSELVGTRWTSYASVFRKAGSDYDSTALLAVDARTLRVLCVRAEFGADFVLYTYEGAGAWARVSALEAPGVAMWAWDDARRVLVGAGPESVVEVDLGPTLDALPATPAPAAKKTAVKKTAVKKPAVKKKPAAKPKRR